MAAHDYKQERTTIESAFMMQADSLLSQAKSAWDEMGNCREFQDARENLARQLDRLKTRTVADLGDMFDRMRRDLSAAWSKPMNEAQRSALETVRAVGLTQGNKRGVEEAARGNALLVSAVEEIVEASNGVLGLQHPEPLDALLRMADEMQARRESRIMQYGGTHDIDVTGGGIARLALNPSSNDERLNSVQSFLDEYGA